MSVEPVLAAGGRSGQLWKRPVPRPRSRQGESARRWQQLEQRSVCPSGLCQGSPAPFVQSPAPFVQSPLPPAHAPCCPRSRSGTLLPIQATAARAERDELVAAERAEVTAAFEARARATEAEAAARADHAGALLRAAEQRATDACRQRDRHAAACAAAEQRLVEVSRWSCGPAPPQLRLSSPLALSSLWAAAPPGRGRGAGSRRHGPTAPFCR